MTPTASSAALWATPRWAWHSVVLAVAISACVFLGLPLLERLAHPPTPGVSARSVQTVVLPPPPAPPPLRAPPPAADRPSRAAPRMEQPRPRLTPLPLALSLGRDLGGLQGDFAADFTIAELGAAAPEQLVFEVAELDTPPRPLVQLPPAYPPQARMRRLNGEVELEFVVSPSGEVMDPRVVSSQPPVIFDAAALQTVRGWRFEPGQRGGRAVGTRVRQSILFRYEAP